MIHFPERRNQNIKFRRPELDHIVTLALEMFLSYGLAPPTL